MQPPGGGAWPRYRGIHGGKAATWRRSMADPPARRGSRSLGLGRVRVRARVRVKGRVRVRVRVRVRGSRSLGLGGWSSALRRSSFRRSSSLP